MAIAMMGTGTPERSLMQRLRALERANDIRIRRARLKEQVRAGRLSARQVLASPPEQAETMKVFDLLLAVPKVGKVKANRMLVAERVSPSKTVGGLSERQRAALIGRLRRAGYGAYSPSGTGRCTPARR